jgi:hypothetical protein
MVFEAQRWTQAHTLRAGSGLDARVNYDLLVTIFDTHTPLL